MDAYELQETVDRWMISGPRGQSRGPLRRAVARAQGPVIHDTNGRRYLDFGSGPSAAILGHNHPRYIEAVKRRLHTIGGDAFVDKDAVQLHRRLGEILTPPLQKSLLVPHGEAALRVAASMARTITGGADVMTVSATHDGTLCFAYPATLGSSRGVSLITTRPATGGQGACPDRAQCSCGAQGGNYPCPWAGFEAAMRACERRPAALHMTPFAGGAFGAWPGCARVLRRLCHQYGMLLIVDETATGYGKTGHMWGYQHDDIVPDVLIVSMRFGAGLSIDAVCTAPDIAEQVSASDCLAIDHAWHDPVGCAAAIAGIDILQEEELVARAARIGEHLKTRLAAMAADNSIITAIHGRGAMYAIELAVPAGADMQACCPAPFNTRIPPRGLAPTDPGMPERGLASAVVLACRDKGLLLREPARGASGGIVRVAPPLVTTETQIDEGLDILDSVLHGMAGTTHARMTDSRQSAQQPGQHQLTQ
ncbi:MAG TPA: aminotransferase class III-fold pyridoxal phosphate-dependent enzyme [Bordetella sp.]|nr:aminotransferase class III-fold pyridoxal phosphate-dependent enzyme [Bordetella sp.]